jgi:hypothetical protein
LETATILAGEGRNEPDRAEPTKTTTEVTGVIVTIDGTVATDRTENVNWRAGAKIVSVRCVLASVTSGNGCVTRTGGIAEVAIPDR